MRVSYNGYYVSFPRKRRGFDYLHPHHCFKALLLSILCALFCFLPANALSAPEVNLSSPRVIIYNLNDDKVLYEKAKELFTSAGRKVDPDKTNYAKKYSFSEVRIENEKDLYPLIQKYKKIKVYWEQGEKRGQHSYYALVK